MPPKKTTNSKKKLPKARSRSRSATPKKPVKKVKTSSGSVTKRKVSKSPVTPNKSKAKKTLKKSPSLAKSKAPLVKTLPGKTQSSLDVLIKSLTNLKRKAR